MRALVVGAGCCGASAARRLAEYGWQVTVIDRRDHIGGNAYDRRDENGIHYHVYGPHIFFTDRERVWSFLSAFACWTPFRCALRVWIEGDSHPMPFQPETLRRLMPGEGDGVPAALAEEFAGRESVTVLEMMNASAPLLRRAGRRLYDCDCAPYNQKQWGLRPEELSPEVIARAPVYLEARRDFRPERFQFMPEKGFAALFQSVLNHPSIEVLTNTGASAFMEISGGQIIWKTHRVWDAVLYTGRLDELFSFRKGILPYRTLKFGLEYCAPEKGLPCLAMYCPGLDVLWTRRTDYRYLPGNTLGMDKTLLVSECPGPMEGPRDEPYYVVLTEQSKALHRGYRDLLEQVPHLYGAGRLADFRYYNMDEAVSRGLDAAEEIHRREGRNQK